MGKYKPVQAVVFIIGFLLISFFVSSCGGETTQTVGNENESANSKTESTAHSGDVLVIKHPAAKSEKDKRERYEWDLLRAALAATEDKYGPFTVEPTPHPIHKNNEEEIMLANDGRLNIMRKATSLEMEEQLLPIRVPLLKGILGHRIFLTNKTFQPVLAEMSPEKLKETPILQGVNWNDTKILNYNGYNVRESQNYDSFFALVANNRVPLFARAIHEAPIELETYSEDYPNLVMDSHFMLIYPFYEYYFVSPANQDLADRIEEGLMILIENGQMDKIFEEYFSGILSKVEVSDRTVIYLDNPFLPEIPLADDPRFFLEIR